MPLFDLPEELLVSVLAYAAVDSPSTLANVALTCRTLYDKVYNSTGVWRTIHNMKYDDPVQACAFHTPRTDYDWRQRVLDRAFVERYLATWTVPDRPQVDSPEIEALWESAPCLFRAVLELYHDLPEQRRPSRNTAMIDAVVTSPEFPDLCLRVGRRNSLANQLHFLVVHYGRGLYNDEPMATFVWFHQARDCGYQWPNSRDMTFWHGASREALFFLSRLATFWSIGPSFDKNLIQRVVEGDLDAVRGHGILGINRPSHCPNDIWDWAGLRGRWQCIFTDKRLLDRNISTGPFGNAYTIHHPLFEDPAFFDLAPVTGPAVLLDAYRAHVNEDDPRVAEYLQLVQVAPASLPPIYFHGATKTKFILGVVHLTKDDPPELRWDLFIVDLATPLESRVFQGIQGGGAGARRGVFGAYRYWDYEHPDHINSHLVGTPQDRVDFRVWTNGGGWIFKDC